MGKSAPEDQYRRLLETVAHDDNVLGVVLAGSRVVPEFVVETSDYDVYVVVTRAEESYRTERGGAIELIDKHGGEIALLVDEKARLSDVEARDLAGEALDGYINSLYRSLRSLEAGRTLAGRLDAAESIPFVLTAVFALEGRVRPFNKWLQYELEHTPLAIENLVQRVDEIRRSGHPDVQRSVFRDVEARARECAFDAVIDAWAPDVAWLRGGLRDADSTGQAPQSAAATQQTSSP